MKSLVAAGLALASAFVLTHTATAAPLINSTSISGGNINYSATQGTGQYLTAGDFFTLYDAGATAINLTGDIASSSLFTISYNLTNTPAMFTSPFDDPTITNLRFTYIGTSNLSDTNLGTFSLADPSGAYRRVSEDGSGHLTGGGFSVNVSSDIAPTLAATPEPSSLMLLGTGAIGVVGAVRRRFKR